MSVFHVMIGDLWSLAFHILEMFQLGPSLSFWRLLRGQSITMEKEKEFNFESKVTLEKLFTSYWVWIPLSFKSEHSVQPPSSSLIVKGSPYLLAMSLPLVERPSWKELCFLVSNRADTEVCNVDTFVDQLLIEILLSRPIDILQIYDYYPWAYL